MVAQIDEQQLAVIALAVYPAGQPRGLPRIGEAQRAAGMAAIGVHVETGPVQRQKARRRTHGSAALVKKRPPGAQVTESVAAALPMRAKLANAGKHISRRDLPFSGGSG